MSTKRDIPPARERRPIFLPLVVVLAVVIAVVVVTPRLTYWLGTAGKAVVTLEPRGDEKISGNKMAALERALHERAEALDLERPFVRRKGEAVTVAFKPPYDFNEVITALSARGEMDFRPVPEGYKSEATFGQIFLIGPDEKKLPAEQVLSGVEPIVRRDDLRRKSSVDTNPQTDQALVRVHLEPTGEQALAVWFAGHQGSLLAVVFDGKVISVAALTARVTRYVNISGIFDRKEAEKIVTCLKTDPLPVEVAVTDKRIP